MTEWEREWELLQQYGLKDSKVRREYEDKVRELKDFPDRLRANGFSEEEIAQKMHHERRELGRLYKEAAPPLLREYIYDATAAKYGDPLGPTYEMLRERKDCRQIIESASRPIENLDQRLTIEGFRKWYEERRQRRQK